MCIGVITSKSGAALHDITDSIWGRWPCAKIYFVSSEVQGIGAAKNLVSAIEKVNLFGKNKNIEILVIGRGGGSVEDLQTFNDESVARAIFASKIPVISAVGHEIDTTIADMVADARASTPTKAGAIAVPDISDVTERIANFKTRLSSAKNTLYNTAFQRFESTSGRYIFKNPKMLIKDRVQMLDEIQWSMRDSVTKSLTSNDRTIQQFHKKISTYEPQRVISKGEKKLEQARVRMKSSIEQRISGLNFSAERQLSRIEKVLAGKVAGSRTGLESLAGKFEGLDPRKTLQRGYSITRAKDSGKIVRDDSELEDGQVLETELADRKYIESKVIKK
jgi:exodeoxyribonuclease VII large subunit